MYDRALKGNLQRSNDLRFDRNSNRSALTGDKPVCCLLQLAISRRTPVAFIAVRRVVAATTPKLPQTDSAPDPSTEGPMRIEDPKDIEDGGL